ncbi:T9SS type A sorting domain-containing protein [Candidatus Omnitrophota bacterium]
MVFKVLTLLSLFLVTSGINAEHHHHTIKCGTPDVLEQLRNGVAKKAGRPAIGTDKGTSVLSSEGHFRVHYDTTGYHTVDMTDKDTNGIPDYIDSTLVYLEYAWELEVDELGYGPPLSDNGAGGGDEVDVYIENFNTGGYGVTYPDQVINGTASSHCRIDNDFSESQYAVHGYDALRVTTAHEFFHVIHFSYLYNFNLSWWMEQSAVWMEDRAWDDVNDYLAYLYNYYGGEHNGSEYSNLSKTVPLDENNGSFKYGAAVWAMFLAQKYGDDQVRIIWETLRDSSYPYIGDFDEALKKGTSDTVGLPEALAEFAVWNYFIYDKANTTDFFRDGDLYNGDIKSDLFWNFSPASDSLDITNLTSRYIELLFVGDWEKNDILSVKVQSQNGGSFKSSVLFYNDPYDYEIIPVSKKGDNIPLSKKWNKAILITSCTNTNSYTYSFKFEADMTPSVGIESSPLYAFTLHDSYPNPFNPSTMISFLLPHPEYVSVQVYSASGQKTADIFNGYLSAGEKRVLWKPSGLAGGLYFVRVSTSQESKTMKVMLLK